MLQLFKDILKLVEYDIRVRIVDYFKSLGFGFVALDLEGYNMGSLNRAIIDEAENNTPVERIIPD